MRTIVLLLLLPALSLAVRLGSCLNVPHSTTELFLHFTDPHAIGYDFSIVTGWRRYHHKISQALESARYSIVPPGDVKHSASCGWIQVADVWVNGIHHGKLSFRDVAQLNTTLSRNGTQKATKRFNSYPAAIHDQVENILWILHNTVPVVDVTILVAELLSPFFAVGLCLVPIYFLNRRRMKSKHQEALDEVELSPMPDNHNFSSSMAPVPLDELDKPPNYTDLTIYSVDASDKS
ncbi:hypothetical protein BU24DRAFT_253284 [Aaosphaeria arxii CBS 175.79]|uniref:Uncharacterized protein n=1 Tax=Aaosphaeria arxii CBS 175.79 TaxID=1450172 RepID=A0A6A5XI66_9PLEO|nr:uncharacterized protein BU24DRAFT_253284 [Aaosphaeria arxii CBS 175.79]KAF2012511.1 hypothetical protein BU24DRAFT_253284 [Aaosphaeria arxii CBS 175.79]